MVNPFEETAIAGDISLTPHDRVQQERDLRIGEAANMYMNTDVMNPTQAATRYVDWKYPPVFGELTPGSKGHPYEGGWGPEHKFQRPSSESKGHNVLRHGLDSLFHKVAPKYRDIIGFPQPSWVDEYINRDVPGQDEISSVDPDDWRTIIKILEAGGNPDDYINVRHDMGDDAEEEGGGWLSNPLLQELRRRNMELEREQMMEDLRRRMMEETQRLQMYMLMNRNKFNTIPGTGDINPIFGDQYWNI
jgi:hypothetical protein